MKSTGSSTVTDRMEGDDRQNGSHGGPIRVRVFWAVSSSLDHTPEVMDSVPPLPECDHSDP